MLPSNGRYYRVLCRRRGHALQWRRQFTYLLQLSYFHTKPGQVKAVGIRTIKLDHTENMIMPALYEVNNGILSRAVMQDCIISMNWVKVPALSGSRSD